MKTTKLLLKESIRNLGRVGDVVEVTAGYARNYLVPLDLAVQPTPSNVKKVEEKRKEIEKLESLRRQQQADLIKKIQGAEVTLVRRANEQGHLYGSVSASEIAKELSAMGHTVVGEDVLLPGKLDKIDVYSARVSFGGELEAEIKVYVSPDAESKEAIKAYAKAKAASDIAAQKAEA